MWLPTDIAFLCSVLYVPLQVISLIRLKDHQLLLFTLTPLPLMIFVYLITWHAYTQESNLWPIFMLLTSPVAVLYLLILLVTRILLLKMRQKFTWKVGIYIVLGVISFIYFYLLLQYLWK